MVSKLRAWRCALVIGHTLKPSWDNSTWNDLVRKCEAEELLPWQIYGDDDGHSIV